MHQKANSVTGRKLVGSLWLIFGQTWPPNLSRLRGSSKPIMKPFPQRPKLRPDRPSVSQAVAAGSAPGPNFGRIPKPINHRGTTYKLLYIWGPAAIWPMFVGPIVDRFSIFRLAGAALPTRDIRGIPGHRFWLAGAALQTNVIRRMPGHRYWLAGAARQPISMPWHPPGISLFEGQRQQTKNDVLVSPGFPSLGAPLPPTENDALASIGFP
jgi:hypothetical protein